MSSPIVTNGHDARGLVPQVAVPNKPKQSRVSKKRIQMLLDQLAAPFDPLVIQWQIVETARVHGKVRGRVLPYADKVAYLERLNTILLPTGWSSTPLVHSVTVEAGERGRATRVKVVVTCQLVIHALGSHSSTGEKWALDENAATSAEAQAFKRACMHFGLGAYLNYFFRGLWVDLDNKGELRNVPPLPVWATTEGWLAGARPSIERIRDRPDSLPAGFDPQTIREIDSMQNELGGQVYRNILRRYRVFFPKDIREPETAQRVLAEMKTAGALMLSVAQALERIGRPAFEEVMRSFQLKSVGDFGDLGMLERVVAALEAKVNSLDAS